MKPYHNRIKFSVGCFWALAVTSVLLGPEPALASDETFIPPAVISPAPISPVQPSSPKRSTPTTLQPSIAESIPSVRSHGSDEALPNLDALPATSIDLATPWDTNLWSRVVAGFAIPDLKGELVERHERTYVNHPELLSKLIERGRPYLYYVVNEVERRGMPMEIALLPVIESAFNPYANSSAQASGLWQIIPSTGRNLGLSQSREHDERRDVIAATQSALDYLEYLHGMFADWQLALAAYNWGEGALGRSVGRNQNKGLPVDYWSISMPSETRNYFPKLQALKNIIRDPSAYGIDIPTIPDRPYFRSVAVDKKIQVEHAARLAGISVNEFSSLNPAFKKPVINGSTGNQYRLLIPVEKAGTFEGRLKGSAAIARTPKASEAFNSADWVSYQVKDGENLEDLAPRFGISVDELKSANGLKGEVRIGAGQTLSVPPENVVNPALKTPEREEAEEAEVHEDETVRWTHHTVHRGETLASIARRYKVSADDIRRWNQLDDKKVQTGKVLRLRVLMKASRSRYSRPVRAKKASASKEATQQNTAKELSQAHKASAPDKATTSQKKK